MGARRYTSKRNSQWSPINNSKTGEELAGRLGYTSVKGSRRVSFFSPSTSSASRALLLGSSPRWSPRAAECTRPRASAVKGGSRGFGPWMNGWTTTCASGVGPPHNRRGAFWLSAAASPISPGKHNGPRVRSKPPAGLIEPLARAKEGPQAGRRGFVLEAGQAPSAKSFLYTSSSFHLPFVETFDSNTLAAKHFHLISRCVLLDLFLF